MNFRGFEFEDQPWFPVIIRDSMTDYLRFLFRVSNLYHPVLPVLKNALTKTKTNHVLDLCSGSGGAVETIYENLRNTFDKDIRITLSDLYPCELTYQHLNDKTQGGISGIKTSVDAANVPSDMKNFRTIFSGFHHFEKQKATEVLNNAVKAGAGIAIFDGGNKSLLMILLLIIFHPVLLLLCTPFFRPLRLSRYIFTYLILIIPFCTIWDGIISIIRLYSPDELLQIAQTTGSEKYAWTSGKVRNRFGMNIAYLVGYPSTENW